MGFTFVAADWFGHTVVLSGEASRPASVTGPFDRESLNSVEQTFTVMVVSFMVAHAKAQGREEAQGNHFFVILCEL
jgi:hypothetical protein